ncbi:MAG: lysostaphin resistance A-like protein [Sandaracinaceae bacterium]
MLRLLTWPVWNGEERRLRALPRLLVLAVLYVVALAPVALAYGDGELGGRLLGLDLPTVDLTRESNPEAAFSDAGLHALILLLTVLTVAVACRTVDRRALDHLGLRVDGVWCFDALAGTLIGVALIGGIAALEASLGWATFRIQPGVEQIPRVAFAGVTLVVWTGVAVNEELLFRGYLFTNTAEGLGGPSARVTFVTLVLTSVLFGLAHALNPHASAVSTSHIVLAGLWLGLGRVLTGELSLPIGLHLGWNLAQNLFGMPVSGQSRFAYGSVWLREEHGPAWLTGGAFGPEAGLTGLAGLVLGIALVLGWLALRGAALRLVPIGHEGRRPLGRSPRRAQLHHSPAQQGGT